MQLHAGDTFQIQPFSALLTAQYDKAYMSVLLGSYHIPLRDLDLEF